MPKTKLPEGDTLARIMANLRRLRPHLLSAADGAWDHERYGLERFAEKNGPTLHKMGLSFLGGGCSRAVFYHVDFPSVVFKVEYRDRDGGDNAIEFRKYTEFKPVYRKHLPKVFDITPDSCILMVQRVNGKEAEQHPDCYDALALLRKIFSGVVYDIHDQNVVISKRGKPYLVDYAACYI